MSPVPRPRYVFSDFILSPARRVLVRSRREVPLIPRYFDLLVLLVERRGQAVHRREIFDAVWSDVVVSDGALSQAVRTLRRALGDDPREPIFIRTVSRHGYRFVFPDVVEQPDQESSPVPRAEAMPSAGAPRAEGDAFAGALERLTVPGPLDDEERREAAEALHALGTAETLARLDHYPDRARARALLRDARWDVAGAGPVPLLGQPDLPATLAWLLWLRFQRTLRLASGRWAGAAAGGALSGLLAGIVGGLVLRFGPGSRAAEGVPAVLGLVGLMVGGLGAAGVGAGLAAAEVLVRSFRGTALVLFGALGGGVVGAGAHFVALWTIQSLFGRDLSPDRRRLRGARPGRSRRPRLRAHDTAGRRGDGRSAGTGPHARSAGHGSVLLGGGCRARCERKLPRGDEPRLRGPRLPGLASGPRPPVTPAA